MRKCLLNYLTTSLYALIAFAMVACTLEVDEFVQNDSNLTGHYKLSIPFEENADDASITRAFLNDEGSSWNFSWENGDEVQFIVYRNGHYLQTGKGTYKRYQKWTSIELDASQPYKAGDVLYFYYSPIDEASTDASAVSLSIPPVQLSGFGQESYFTTRYVEATGYNTLTKKLKLSKLTLDKTSYSSTSTTPEARKVTFTIGDYDANNEYTYSTDGRAYQSLTTNNDGSATVNVNFSSISFGSSGQKSATQTIYVKCNNGSKAATFPIQVNATRKSSGNNWRGSSSSSYTYSYTYVCGSVTQGSYVYNVPYTYDSYETVTAYESSHIMPVTNCMPLVCEPITVTKSMINNNSIGSAISFNLTSALIEFRLYSDNQDIADEKIKTATFTAANNQGIAGQCKYNFFNNPLAVSGFDHDAITSDVSACNFFVPRQKANYVSIYMVASPGTYAGTLEVLTDKALYTVNVPSNQYKRATRKPWSLNLAGASVTRTPLGEESDIPDPEQSGDEPGDEPTVYDVITTLDNVAFAGSATATKGEPFTATIAAEDGYENLEVTVTMGGVDITATAYVNGQINIEAVTGEIVITATATEAIVYSEYNLENKALQKYISYGTYSKFGATSWFSTYSSVLTQSLCKSQDDPAYVPASWNGSSSDTYYVTLTDQTTSTVKYTDRAVKGNSYEFINLVPGRQYEYTVTNAAHEQVKRGGFRTTGQVRMVTISDSWNYRDMGGWKGLGNKPVRYEWIYRGGHLDGVNISSTHSYVPETSYRFTDACVQQIADLGIKAELDLRGERWANEEYNKAFGHTLIPLDNMDYANIITDYAIDTPLSDYAVVQDAAWIIHEVLERQKPVAFHCRSGADRTGAVGMMIGAILGVQPGDLARDYEITTFTSEKWQVRQASSPSFKGFYYSGMTTLTPPSVPAGSTKMHAQAYYYLNQHFKSKGVAISATDIDNFIMFMLDMDPVTYSAYRPSWAENYSYTLGSVYTKK